MFELKFVCVTLALSLVALISPNEQSQILCAAVIASGLSGYMGALFFPGKHPGHLSLKRRWAANLCTGVCVGPAAAVHLHPSFPDQPLLFLTLVTSGAIGALGVLFLTLIIEPLFRWIIQRFLPPSPPRP